MKKSWDDLLKPIEPLGEDEMTLAVASERLGVKDTRSALIRLRELEKTGAIISVGQRKLPNGYVAKAWKLL